MTGPAAASRELGPATFLQQGLWPRLRHAAPGDSFTVRAVRFTGEVQLERLRAAIREVHAAFPALDIQLVDSGGELALGRHGGLDLREHDLRQAAPGAREAACIAVLRDDLERPVPADGALTRFHTVRLTEHEVVLGLVCHELVLDERSVYLVLGAVLQAYQQRFRRSSYRDFTELLDFYPLPPAVAASRRTWWSRWLAGCPAPVPGAPATRETETSTLTIPGADWRALADSGGTMRDNGSLGVAALVAWWLGGIAGTPVPALATVLDLRDYGELGPVVGPLTDRIAFRVELAAGTPSFRQLFRKAQVGVLRSTTRYLPYRDVVDIATELGQISPPRTAALWDVDVHLCANPPSSGRSRGHEHGISAELLREAALIAPRAGTDTRSWDGTNVAVRMNECDGGMALTIDVNRLHPRYAAASLAHRLGQAIATAAADPEAPLLAV
jgi:hypothetical protein